LIKLAESHGNQMRELLGSVGTLVYIGEKLGVC